jgi:nicotinamide-nucleotide amidase
MDEVVQALAKSFVQRGWTLGLAESCTGGLMSSEICRQPGASRYFLGAVVSYAGAAKRDLLGVDSARLSTHGEVSLVVARDMAQGARRQLRSDWAVAVTGIAGPTGGSVEKPVGFVCFAVVGPGFERLAQKHFPPDGGRQDIQRQAALFAFDLLASAIR